MKKVNMKKIKKKKKSEYEESALELGIAAECRIPHGSTVTK